MTRQQISQAIAKAAPDVPFTMPLFLAGELLKECRRQGLRKLTDKGPDHLITVKITGVQKPKPKALCWECGKKDVAICKPGYLYPHRNKSGQWCPASGVTAGKKP